MNLRPFGFNTTSPTEFRWRPLLVGSAQVALCVAGLRWLGAGWWFIAGCLLAGAVGVGLLVYCYKLMWQEDE